MEDLEILMRWALRLLPARPSASTATSIGWLRVSEHWTVSLALRCRHRGMNFSAKRNEGSDISRIIQGIITGIGFP